MRRTLISLGFFAALFSPTGCHLEERIDELEQKHEAQSRAQERKLNEARFEVKLLKEEVRRLWSRVACNSDSVKDFLHTCEQEGIGCSGYDVANAFKAFLDTQDYVRVYLRPDIGTDSLTKLRQQQLEDQGAPTELHPGTRFIVVVLPRSSSTTHQEEAERLGRQVVRYLRSRVGIPAAYRILGPKTLPCNYKREEILRHKRKIDQRQVNEPTEGEPTVHAWVFRTECI